MGAGMVKLHDELVGLYGEIACRTPLTWRSVNRLLRMIHRIETGREIDAESWWINFPVSPLTAAVIRGIDGLYDVSRRDEGWAQLRYDDEQKARAGESSNAAGH